MVRTHSLADKIVDGLIYLILTTLALSCLLPFINLVATSLSSAGAIMSDKVTLWPVQFHLGNYQYIFTTDRQFLRSLGISTVRVLFGVSATLLITVITAYPLSLDQLYMPGRTVFKIVMLVGMLFGGGLIPYFMAVKSLGLIDKFAVLIIPGSLDIFSVILLINFFRGLPKELSEAAMIDGATPMDVLFRIFLPLSLPSLATITLFSAVGHWNSWFDAVLFLNRSTSWPVQAYAYNRLMQGFSGESKTALTFAKLPDISEDGLIATFIVFIALPIMCVYPFLQRYFVKGLTLGSIKG